MSFGNRGGRPRKPLEQHLAAGTFRKDRHGAIPPRAETNGDAVDEIDPEAVYVPNENDKPATEMYRHLTDLLGNAVKPSDTPLLCVLSEIWGLYQTALAYAKDDPLDKDARCSLLAYAAEFSRLASRFGLSPSDRSRLQLDFEPERPDKLAKYLDGGIPKRIRE